MTDTSSQSWKIRCICRYDDDDGFTIQCEQCEIWQHAVCVGIDTNQVPDKYLCDCCNPRDLDVDNANEIQTQRKALENSSENHNRKKRLTSSSRSSNAASHSRKIASSANGDNKYQRAPSRPSSTLSSTNGKANRRINLTEESETETEINHFQTEYISIESNLISNDLNNDELIAKLAKVDKDNVISLQSVSVRPVSSSNINVSQFGVFAVRDIPDGTVISEILGEIYSKSLYKSSTCNQYEMLGVPKPHVFFAENLDICLDAQTYGNELRFLRRSCKPNAQIVVYLGLDDNEDKSRPHFMIRTLEHIQAGSEVTICWSFRSSHPLLDLIYKAEQSSMEVMDMNITQEYLHVIELIKSLADCVCDYNDGCIFYKAISYIQKIAKKNEYVSGDHATKASSLREMRKIKEIITRIDRLEQSQSRKRKRNFGTKSASLSPDMIGSRRSTDSSKSSKLKRLKRLKLESFTDTFSLRKSWAQSYISNYMSTESTEETSKFFSEPENTSEKTALSYGLKAEEIDTNGSEYNGNHDFVINEASIENHDIELTVDSSSGEFLPKMTSLEIQNTSPKDNNHKSKSLEGPKSSPADLKGNENTKVDAKAIQSIQSSNEIIMINQVSVKEYNSLSTSPIFPTTKEPEQIQNLNSEIYKYPLDSLTTSRNLLPNYTSSEVNEPKSTKKLSLSEYRKHRANLNANTNISIE